MKTSMAKISENLADSRVKDAPAFERARQIVLKYGWNTTSYQILNPGIERWFAPTVDAVVGYVSANGRRVAAGAPICSKENLSEAAAGFESDAARNNERVCYFCAETAARINLCRF